MGAYGILRSQLVSASLVSTLYPAAYHFSTTCLQLVVSGMLLGISTCTPKHKSCTAYVRMSATAVSEAFYVSLHLDAQAVHVCMAGPGCAGRSGV